MNPFGDFGLNSAFNPLSMSAYQSVVNRTIRFTYHKFYLKYFLFDSKWALMEDSIHHRLDRH